MQNVVSRGVNRHLIVITAQRSHQPKLISGRFIENDRAEPAKPRGLIVHNFCVRSFQPKISAITRQASIVGEAVGVIAKADLVIGVVITSVAEYKFALAVTLEA